MTSKPTTTIAIHLDITGDPADALAVVNDVLDSGVLQDSINENDTAVLQVTSAVALHLPTWNGSPRPAVPQPQPSPEADTGPSCNHCGARPLVLIKTDVKQRLPGKCVACGARQ